MEAKSKLHLSAHTNAPLELEQMMSPSTELLNCIEEQNNFPQLDSCMVTVSYCGCVNRAVETYVDVIGYFIQLMSHLWKNGIICIPVIIRFKSPLILIIYE